MTLLYRQCKYIFFYMLASLFLHHPSAEFEAKHQRRSAVLPVMDQYGALKG
jgi:hypothetical protein